MLNINAEYGLTPLTASQMKEVAGGLWPGTIIALGPVILTVILGILASSDSESSASSGSGGGGGGGDGSDNFWLN